LPKGLVVGGVVVVVEGGGKRLFRIVNNSVTGQSDVVAKEQKRDPKSRLFI